MANQPVKLDMSTFQPVPNSNVRLDFSKAQRIPIPKGATIGTVPIPEGASIGSPSQLDMSTYQPIDFSKYADQGQSQAIDFSKYASAAPDPTPSGFWQSVKARLQSPLSAGPMGQGDLQPQAKPSGPVTDSAWDQQKQVLKDSFNEMVDNVTHPSQLLHMLPGWDQIKDKITPKQIQQWQQGDKSGAAGTTLVDIGNLITGGASAAAPEAFGAPVTSAANAAVRGAAKATNAILRNAPDVIPSAIAPPIVKKIASKLTVPGEDFGVDYYDKSVLPDRSAPLRAPQTVNPVPQPPAAQPAAVPTAAERAAYLEGIKAKRQAMGLGKAQAAVSATAAPAASPSAASAAVAKFQADTAKAVGADSWASVNPSIQQQAMAQAAAPGGELHGIVPPAESPAPITSTTVPEKETEAAAKPSTPEDVVDAAIPPSENKALNMKTKAEVNFYVQKGDVGAAKAAIQKAAMMSAESPAATSKMFQPPTMTAAQRADFLDDKAVQQQIEAREGSDMVSTRNPNWQLPDSMEALISDATRRKAATSSLGRLVRGEEEIPLPGTPKGELAKQMQMPGGSPITDEDLTEILQQSVEAAKKAKQGFTKQPSPVQTNR